MTPILAGLRVIDLSSDIAGAVTTMLLGDHGAEVIKVEPPGGDPLRAIPGSIVWNRGKQSVELDLERTDARDVVRRLAQSADIVVHTLSPGTVERLGMTDDALRADNSRLIVCWITGYGTESDERERAAHDALVQARSGMQYEQPGLRDGPVFLHAPLPSFGAALLADVGISAALRAREITGVGQLVETSLMQGALVWMTQLWRHATTPTPPLFEMWQYKDLVPTPCFEAGDGRWFHPMTNGLPIALAHVGRDPAELDLRVMISGDRPSRERFFASARELLRQRPRDEWVELFQRNDVNCQPIEPAEPVFDHPQLVHTGGVVTIDVPQVGPVTQLGHAYRLADHDNPLPGPPPKAGEHTASVLAVLAEPRTMRPASGAAALEHALAGIRVLDFGTVIAGPFGGMILADLGADVVKIDPVTASLTAAVGTPGDATWASSNRGKRSLAVDLKSAGGQEIVRRLIATADVIHDNLRAGVAERLGFGHEQAHAINPAIICSHLTAYGGTGPLATWPGSDQTAQALCGLEYEQGATPAGGHPTWYRFGMTDAAAGLLSVIGILQALYQRERTGAGQVVETDILRAGMLLASDAFVGPASLPRRAHLDLAQTGLGPWYRLYRTSDGWLCIAATTDEQREQLARWLGVDRRLADVELAAEMEQAFRTRAAADASGELDALGVPNEIAGDHTDDWWNDPISVASGFVTTCEHPVWGQLTQPGPFVRLARTPGCIRGAPPMIGEHTDELLRELGFTDAELAGWRSDGTIGG